MNDSTNSPVQTNTNLRVSTFNASLNRNNQGQLITDLSTSDHPQAKNIAEIIQRSNPDVILLNEFDYDLEGIAVNLFRQNYLEVSQNGANPVEYPYIYLAPSNTGVASGFDLDNNGSIGGGNDAFGFGNFEGQYAMVLLSKYPILTDEVRTFQNFLWKDMPHNLLTNDPTIDNPNTTVNENLNGFYSPEEIANLRLSSKSHWDVPINVNGEILHVLAAHPTPPVFDGSEDRNGKRNFDEIRFWTDYVTPGENAYIYDDQGNTGGLTESNRFVILGDYNADPFDGDSYPGAANQFFATPAIQGSTTDIAITPTSVGAPDAGIRQGGLNLTSLGNPAFDTADFGPDTTVPNLRVDYVLPSYNTTITNKGVFWPVLGGEFFDIVGEFDPTLDSNVYPSRTPSSDHRLVYVDLNLTNNNASDQNRQTVTNVEFLGLVTFPTGTNFNETQVGGLSGITYDSNNGVYYAISDDRSQINPARFYTLTIDLSDSSLGNGDVAFTNVTTLLNDNGNAFTLNSNDPEGIALTKEGTVYISSEGLVNTLIDPFVNEFSLSGLQLSELPIDDKFLATSSDFGIRNNLAFESLTITPDGRYLYTANENALKQDGTISTLDNTGYSRIVKYDLSTGEVVAEYVYEVDAIPKAPIPDTAVADNGLVELIALDNNGTFLALERSFATGVGNTIKLYQVSTQGALNVKDFDDLFREEPLEDDGEIIAPDRFSIDPFVSKTLLLDFADLGITPDNLEGMTLGEKLADGRQSLIVVSDNNFSNTQTTQVIALALDIQTTPAVLPTIETPYTIDQPSGDAELFGDSDDVAVWIDPDNAENSIVIATLKDGGLTVFSLEGEILQTITAVDMLGETAEYGDIRYNNVDLIYNFTVSGIAGNFNVDLAIASDRENDSLAIFGINPETHQLYKFTTPELDDPNFSIFGVDDGDATAYGLANYRSPITGDYYVFVTQAGGNKIAQLKLTTTSPADLPLIYAEVVRIIELPVEEGKDAEDYQSEAIAVDQQQGIVYLAVEGELGIVKFDAEPNGNNEITIVRPVDSPELVPDLEGLGIYYGANGQGYLIASSQGDSSYAVYNRAGNNEYLGSFIIGDNGNIDQVNETDGLDIINVPLGSNFPFGAFLVQDGANEPQNVVENDDELENNATNFKFVPWENVANAFETPLIIDTQSYNPRNFEPISFVNGVASGDVDQDSAVLWTRSLVLGEVTFAYSTDANFNNIIGTVTATVGDINQPVKVEITNLQPNTEYYYQVTEVNGETEEGRFQTAANLGTFNGLSFGVTGDWRGELAPYTSISNLAEKELDFLVLQGDTIYADYGSDAVLNPDGTRKEQAETLAEYRAKHSEVYSSRLGENFLADVRSSTSILATIDDHEVINDFAGGELAANDERFGETEGLINDTALYENGLQAFQEYNPLEDRFYEENTGDARFDGERQLYRYNTYGSDAAVIAIDTRSFRDEALPTPDFTNPSEVQQTLIASLTLDRTLLGSVQLADLKADLLQADSAGFTWKFVMIPEPIQNILPGITTDSYEGYGKERTELLQFIEANKIQNVVFVAADVHTTYVNNLTYQTVTATGLQQTAVPVFEITTGSVAFDPPTGEILANIITAQDPTGQLALLYNSLPIAPDPTDSAIPDDKDDFVEQAINTQILTPSGFDPLGLDHNLAIANGLIEAELLQGDYFVGHTFGWSQFDIDPITQALTITTYGIEAYSEEELLANPSEILNLQPQIMSKFIVNPNQAPVVENQTFILPPNSAVGTIIGAIAASDPNENQQELLKYSLDDPSGRFAINETTGEITLINNNDLNSAMDFSVTVTDPANLSTTAGVTINLTSIPKVVNGTSGDDYFDSAFPDAKNFVGYQQTLFTGSGDDTVDVSQVGEGNRIDTGSGDDMVFAGTNNRIILGAGDDILFAGSGNGGNLITGGAGADQFWLIQDEEGIPEMINKINDFKNEDVIGFMNTDLSLANKGSMWNYAQNGDNVIISAFGQEIAQLLKTTISDANFVFA